MGETACTDVSVADCGGAPPGALDRHAYRKQALLLPPSKLLFPSAFPLAAAEEPLASTSNLLISKIMSFGGQERLMGVDGK
mmetsp:Transcript_21323/g.29874  ORF Transcript_21323/g.29874 Transcript_21323/m.29874 type:complete len:81 (+) Transcript_21323:343-585(+)